MGNQRDAGEVTNGFFLCFDDRASQYNLSS